jgi:hypothetical protein
MQSNHSAKLGELTSAADSVRTRHAEARRTVQSICWEVIATST